MDNFKLGYSLLGPKQKRAAVLLFFLIIIAMVLETLGISLILPALTILLDYESFSSNEYGQLILAYLNNPSQEKLLTIGLTSIVLIYFIKILFLGYMSYKQSLFVFDVQRYLSLRLVKGYLNHDYTFHLKRNSAQLIRNATSEVAIYVSGVVGITWILTELFMIVGILALLSFIEPRGTLIILFAFSIAGYLFRIFTHERIEKWGELRAHSDGMRIQQIQQGIGSIKDLIMLGRIDSFVRKYSDHNDVAATVGQKQGFLQGVPRLWIEAMVIVGIVLLVLVMLAQGKESKTLIPILAVFATAAYRLMPSISKLMNGLQSISYASPVIKNLNYEVENLPKDTSSDFSSPGVNTDFNGDIELSNLCFSFSDNGKDTIKDISFKINKGETLGICGKSGAGKSTLVNLILGLLSPRQGNIFSNDIDIYKNINQWRKKIGYIPQDIYLSDDTIRNNIALGLVEDEIDDEAVLKAVRISSLDEFTEELDEGLDTKVGERGVRLSGGQRQRIGIARALYNDPDILVMDEATSALDVEIEESIMQAIENLKGIKTIIIIAHRLTVIDRCDRVINLHNGSILKDK